MKFNRLKYDVFAGCCASAFFMELLMVNAPQIANLITCLQFLFITIQGFIVTAKFGTVKPKIPLKQYVYLVCLFFITSVVNNYVYSLHVPSTLHMIIRSASSPASMLVSWFYKKRSPKLTNAIGSILISIGVATAMYGGVTVAEQIDGQFVYWCIGVTILIFMLFLGAFTGLQQEILYTKHGKHPEEMMFYTHALSMPFFLPMYPQMKSISNTLGWDIWIFVALNIISQFFCTQSVHQLATTETSVTVTFILTLRKFVSLILSGVVFKKNLTIFHVIGGAFVIVGTYIYFDCFSARKQKPVTSKD